METNSGDIHTERSEKYKIKYLEPKYYLLEQKKMWFIKYHVVLFTSRKLKDVEEQYKNIIEKLQ